VKALLGALMCLVFTITQAFAISGGPPYPGGTNVVGVYAGVMKPKNPPSDNPPNCSLNSLGVFSVGVADSGLATGSFVMFSQGRVFSGSIQGTADPGKDANKATLKAVLSATFNFTVTFPPTPCPNPTPAPACTPSGFSQQVTATANGSLDTHIKSQSSQTNLGASSVRLVGSATIDISQGQVDPSLAPIVSCEMILKVGGFKQTTTAPTTSSSG
jgi:hypothetical protein